ncbi:MAG: OmpA family protein [Caulobacteraceae bacterium]|nr:OmpA family protein [Caulobacteraceae bacterium]
MGGRLIGAILASVLVTGCASGLKRDDIVQPASACGTSVTSIYFEADSHLVTDEGRAVIAQAASEARNCKISYIEIVGLADAVGAPDANQQLSERRAEAVTSALVAAGLPTGDLRVAAAGQAGSVTPDGEARPLRRRADIIIHQARR